jgi:hypothetical protein
MQRVMHPAKQLVIDLMADEVRVSEDEAAPREYAPGDTARSAVRGRVAAGGTAAWKGARLEMRQVLGRRGAIVESYELSRDGRLLTIRAHREGGMPGIPAPVFTRVYTRYEGD